MACLLTLPETVRSGDRIIDVNMVRATQVDAAREHNLFAWIIQHLAGSS